MVNYHPISCIFESIATSSDPRGVIVRLLRWQVHNRQQDVAGLVGQVKYGLARDPHFVRSAEILTRVGIPVKLRKMTAGNVDSDAMTGQEDIGSARHVDQELIGLSRFEQLHLVKTFSEPRAQNPFSDIHRKTVGMHINKLVNEVCIRAVRGRMELQLHRPSDRQRLL